MTDTLKTNQENSNDETKTDESSQETTTTHKIKTSIEELAEVQSNLDQIPAIKKHISEVLHALAQNPSFFNRVATYWTDIPLWLKIIIGIVAVVPTLVLGIVFQFISLIVISVLSLIIYAGSAYLLDDHNNHTSQPIDQLLEQMDSLADILDQITKSFDPLHKELVQQVTLFHAENDRLIETEETLSDRILKLTQHGENLRETAKGLKNTNEQLQDMNTKIESSNRLQQELLELNIQEMKRIDEEREKNDAALAETIKEIEAVRIDLSERLRQIQVISDAYQANAVIFSNHFIKEQEDRDLLLGKLTEFVSGKNEQLEKVAARILQANTQLAQAKEELRTSNKRNEDLQDRLDKVLTRIERHAATQNTQRVNNNGKALRKFGLMAHDENTDTNTIHLPDQHNYQTQRVSH